MLDCANAGTALSSEVDVEFLTLILQDEEWLEAEFGTVQSEPSELPGTPQRVVSVATDRSSPDREPPSGREPGASSHLSVDRCKGQGAERTRSPPQR